MTDPPDMKFVPVWLLKIVMSGTGGGGGWPGAGMVTVAEAVCGEVGSQAQLTDAVLVTVPGAAFELTL